MKWISRDIYDADDRDPDDFKLECIKCADPNNRVKNDDGVITCESGINPIAQCL